MKTNPVEEKRFTPIFLVGLLIVFFLLSAVTSSFSNEVPKLFPDPRHPRKCKVIISELEQYHYSEKQLDDAQSAIILRNYIKRLDPGKRVFTSLDITMFNQFEYQLDNELAQGNIYPAFQIFNLYLSRSVNRIDHTLSLIQSWENHFDFTTDDTLIVDNDLRQWQPDYPSLINAWEKDLKNHIITMLLDNKPPKAITKELKKLYTNRKKRILQTTSSDVFDTFMNAVTASFDPHTQYFPPRVAEDFDINMSLSLEGIGAVLQNEYEYTKIVRLIPKGPADKSNLLMPGDKIIGVGQGKKGEIKDTIGLRIDNVVKLIRGPKDSIVRLKIIPAKESTTTKTIQIKRDTVKLEDQSAHKSVMDITHKGKPYKIGIIELPSFYVDFDGYRRGIVDYRSATRDVKKILNDLQKEEIDGLIIDLRDDGGGSLQEAAEMTGLFIKSGPVVQVRYKDKLQKESDLDNTIYYSGPLIVMINRMSASASEIFAGAIKDYNRGIIVGSRSFGKGTVQQMRRLDRTDDSKLKLTEAKFYRVSGESTQLKGILPDVEYPQFYKDDQTGESAQEGALPWDKIFKTFYHAYPSLDTIIKKLNQAYHARAEQDPHLSYLKKRIELGDTINAQTQISLNLEERKFNLKTVEQQQLNIENQYLESIGKPTLKELTAETSAIKGYKNIIMEQTHRVMADFIAFSKDFKQTWD